MNLIVDQGNTAMKVAFFDGGVLLHKNTFNADEFDSALTWVQSISEKQLNLLVCNVTDRSFPMERLTLEKKILLTETTALPIANGYETPATLGKDRLANAVGAWCLNPGSNSLSIDLGTCIKYDLITANGVYLGGAISPGLTMRFQALNEFTDKLPLLNAEFPDAEIGTNTETSIVAGVKLGMVHEIKGFIQRYSSELDRLTIFMTGGDLKYFEKAFKNRIFANPDLTLIGLNEILQHNLLQK